MDDIKTPLSYDTMVLSGSSVKGFAFLGGLQYLHDNNLLKNIKTYIGTSSGAFLSYLLAIGYTPIEIFVYLHINQVLDKMQHFNLVAMIQGRGASSFNSLQEHLEKMSINKIGYLPTLDDIKQKFGINLVCVTHNLTEDKTEYLCYETHPTIPCITALHMSANLPLIFERYKYGHSFYIDGGISDQFAIQIAENLGDKIIGLCLQEYKVDLSEDVETNTLEYIYTLMNITAIQSVNYKIKLASKEKCTIIKINCGQKKFFNFDIKSAERMDMFTSGYQQLFNFYK